MSAATPERARRVRADAQRNIDALLDAAREVFGTSGVDAPVREIVAKAGVGLATFYRHFPERSDLVGAVFRHEVDACADTATLICLGFVSAFFGRRTRRMPSLLSALMCSTSTVFGSVKVRLKTP